MNNMQMHVKSAVLAFLYFFIFYGLAKRNRNEYGVTEYMIRINNITTCPGTEVTAFPYDLRLNKYNFHQLVSIRINVTQDVVLSRINLRVIRCQQYEYGCEDFQSWNFTNFCALFKLNNIFTSHIINAITPSTFKSTCPTFKKGIYTVTNLTVDAREILKVYPEAARYAWKTLGRGYTSQGKVIACVYSVGAMLSYTKRIRH